MISFYRGASEKDNMRAILKISLRISAAIGITAYLLLLKYTEIPVHVFVCGFDFPGFKKYNAATAAL